MTVSIFIISLLAADDQAVVSATGGANHALGA